MLKKLFTILCFISGPALAEGYDVFSIGYFDIKFDGSTTNEAIDFRYERRFDNSILDIGPESENFFLLKAFCRC